jgi:hypothetical protein
MGGGIEMEGEQYDTATRGNIPDPVRRFHGITKLDVVEVNKFSSKRQS